MSRIPKVYLAPHVKNLALDQSASSELFGINALNDPHAIPAASATAAAVLNRASRCVERYRHIYLATLLLLGVALAASSFLLQNGRSSGHNPACGANREGVCRELRGRNETTLAMGLRTLKMTSHYQRWIRKDLAIWQDSGITRVSQGLG